MKRTKNKIEETLYESQKELKWIKKGGGIYLTKDGKVIKPNEVFHAPLSDIPNAFRDIIVLVEDD